MHIFRNLVKKSSTMKKKDIEQKTLSGIARFCVSFFMLSIEKRNTLFALDKRGHLYINKVLRNALYNKISNFYNLKLNSLLISEPETNVALCYFLGEKNINFQLILNSLLNSSCLRHLKNRI